MPWELIKVPTALSREERISGCLLGGALGDAIGSHFEGSSGIVDFAIPAVLSVTDDTQLTIATCEAIIDSQGVSPQCVANHFLRWFRQRRITGIGSSTLKALTELDAGGHWALVGATGERAAGNGAAMRIAPLAFFLDPDSAADRQAIRDVCRITHRNDEAYIGALALLWSIRRSSSIGKLDLDLLGFLAEMLPDSRLRDRIADLAASVPSIDQYASRFGTTGYVVDSVLLAILAAIQCSDPMDSIRQLVCCGGDTDTIASMFGQLYGAANGIDAFPGDVIDQIDAVKLVRETASRLSGIAIATQR
jgi:ADP-ribosylglycohydrolase